MKQATTNKPAVVDDKRMLLRVHLVPAFGRSYRVVDNEALVTGHHAT